VGGGGVGGGGGGDWWLKVNQSKFIHCTNSLISILFQSITLFTSSQHSVNLACMNQIYLTKK
jgi:hypothetical protein